MRSAAGPHVVVGPRSAMGAAMRVAIVNQHPTVALGGSETQCALIADGLARRGHVVRYVAVGGARGEGSTAGGVEVVAVERSPRAAVAACRAHRPDVVYWRIERWGLRRATRALGRAGIPVVFAASHVDDLRRIAPGRSARPPGPLRALELARSAVRSAWSFGALRRTAGVIVNNADHLALVPQGVPATHIANGVDDRREPFGWPRPCIAWVANLKPAKRPEACIPLAEAIAPLGVDLIMAGRVQVPGYERFEDPTRLPANLHFLGPLPQTRVNGLLATSLLNVHTCEPEGFPNVFIQAWAQGRPSVSLGFDPEGMIAEHGLGEVCGDDPVRFAAAVRRLLEDDDLRRSAGERARALVGARFDAEGAVRRLEEFLGDVIA